MPVQKSAESFRKNLLFAFSAQGVALLLNTTVFLAVPRVLGVGAFAYWQLFLFYCTYAGFFLFGLNDGIYLRIGGQAYSELDFPSLGGQFRLSVLGQLLLAALLCLAVAVAEHDPARRLVLFTAAGYMVLFNLTGFLGSVFQAADHTRWYSGACMAQSGVLLLCVLALLIFRVQDYMVYMLFELVSQACALLLSVVMGRKIVFVPLRRAGRIFREIRVNITVGIHLMLSNIAGMLILGVGRLLVDHTWGIEAFGRFSFAVSLTNFFLLFIGQIGMVLFPALRKIPRDGLRDFFKSVRNGLGTLLCALPLLYLPARLLLCRILPQYTESVDALALLLPICVFDGKMQLLYATCLKVLRRERLILRINVLACLCAALLGLIGAYAVRSVNMVVLSMVAAIALRSIAAEICLLRQFHLPFCGELVAESALSVLFVAFSMIVPATVAFGIYLLVYMCYLMVWKRRLIGSLGGMAKKMVPRKAAASVPAEVVPGNAEKSGPKYFHHIG